MYNNGPKIITDGLVACFDAANPRSYPGSGTDWIDLVGNGNGTMVNSPDISVGLPKSFTFSANTEYFSLAANGTFKNNVGDITMCAWCRQNNTDGSPHQTVVCTDYTYRSGIKLMSYYHGNPTLWMTTADGTGDYMINGDSIVGTGWRFLAGSWNQYNGEMKLYVDGILKASGTAHTGSMYNVNKYAAIGVDYHSTAYYYRGNIGYVLGYNRVLSAQEILQIYNATKRRFIISPSMITENLTLYLDASLSTSYPGSGTTWTNLGSGASNATLTNGPTYSPDYGGVINFDGNNDRAIVTTIVFGNGNWTVNMLVNFSAYAHGAFGELFSNSSGGPVGNAMGINGSGKITYANYNGAWYNIDGTSTLSLNTWYYLTWVNKNDNTMTMYVNAVQDSTPTNSLTGGGPCDAIGCNWYAGYTGKIASVSYYTSAHTPQQIAQNCAYARWRAGV